jgi:hypothetical protein
MVQPYTESAPGDRLPRTLRGMSRGDAGPADELMFRPIHTRNPFEETFERLSHAIRIEHVAAGEKLPSERALAARLGVSRVTLREVLRALEQVGYVTSRSARARGGAARGAGA